MTKLNSYLNFAGNAEEAFNFYKTIFGGEINLLRFKDVDDLPGKERLSQAELNKVMHVSLNIGDNLLMATDMLESFGQQLKVGNNITLSLHPENKAEGDRLYKALSQGGKAQQPMAEMFWGYWGMLTDQFNINWMVNCVK
jgi:PhnB protein